MSGNIYSQRMKELDGKQQEKTKKLFPNLSRPAQIKRGSIEELNGNLRPVQEQPAEMDLSSMFGRSFEQYKGEDSRFGQLTDDYTKLISGLKNSVDSGMMPEVIAKQKIQQFLQDSRGYFSKNKAKPTDNPKVAAMLEGMLEGDMEMQQGGAPMPQEQQMPQGGM